MSEDFLKCCCDFLPDFNVCRPRIGRPLHVGYTRCGDRVYLIFPWRHLTRPSPNFWPHNVVKRGICYERVCPSFHLMPVSRTSGSRQTCSRYRKCFLHNKIKGVSSFFRPRGGLKGKPGCRGPSKNYAPPLWAQ